MVTQFCELYPQHRTAVSASPVTVGALDHVRYLEQSGGHMLTESFTARDPNQTLRSPRGLPLALPGARQRHPVRALWGGLMYYITPRVAPRGFSGAGATTDSRGRGFPGLRSRQIESAAPRRMR